MGGIVDTLYNDLEQLRRQLDDFEVENRDRLDSALDAVLLELLELRTEQKTHSHVALQLMPAFAETVRDLTKALRIWRQELDRNPVVPAAVRGRLRELADRVNRLS